MDLLGSILNSMDKPPAVGEKQKQQMKKQKLIMQKRQDEERNRINQFREKTEAQINKLIQDESQQRHTFQPMDKIQRSIVHDVAEIAGLTCFSFGEEEIDRHVVVFKKEFAPCDEELAALRRGDSWDPEKAKEEAKQREIEKELEAEAMQLKPSAFTPNANYKDKYERLIGKEAAVKAAKKTMANKQFGFVPSENKRDLRSIEQTLADIKAKKKLKKSDAVAVDNTIYSVNGNEASVCVTEEVVTEPDTH